MLNSEVSKKLQGIGLDIKFEDMTLFHQSNSYAKFLEMIKVNTKDYFLIYFPEGGIYYAGCDEKSGKEEELCNKIKELNSIHEVYKEITFEKMKNNPNAFFYPVLLIYHK